MINKISLNFLRITFFFFASSIFSCYSFANSENKYEKPETWYLQTIMMNLDAKNRFIGTLVIHNTSNAPIYVKSSAEQVLVVDGKRERRPVQNGALQVYPEEFVLAPGNAFTARVVADPHKMTADSQSYYVKFVDISNIRADEQQRRSMQSAYLLGFEALVTVNRRAFPPLATDQFQLQPTASGYTLTNDSGHHIYLDQGGLCPASKPELVRCKPLPEFPKQSMLPGETVPLSLKSLSPAPGDLIGVLAYDGLNQGDRAAVLYLPMPQRPQPGARDAAATASIPATPVAPAARP
ncbi:hypothetical protein [Pseudacidovorax intermedius]|nr:hypothetical protein [Pseudacidovorax intermedius]